MKVQLLSQSSIFFASSRSSPVWLITEIPVLINYMMADPAGSWSVLTSTYLLTSNIVNHMAYVAIGCVNIIFGQVLVVLRAYA